MEIYYTIIMFIIGTIFGSFYNVVGLRIPNKMSLISPPSHCPNCKTPLKPIELIPILSYIFQKGKCKHCQKQIPIFYPIIELLTGCLFALAYISFGLNINIIIPITFISMLIIIIVSDYNYMIISDSILLTFSLILTIEILLIYDVNVLIVHIIAAILSFFTMWGLKKIGDYLFKRESMGGGDIKLLATFGLVIGYPMAILSIFIGSIIALPISLLTLKNNSKHIIPFGPFLAIAAIIIILTKLDFNFLTKIIGN